jgi:hypothetical protein
MFSGPRLPFDRTGRRTGWPAAILTLVVTASGFAQIPAGEVARRAFWETFLLKAKITEARPLGEGVTRPKKLRLERDGLTAFGVWKRPSFAGSGRFDRWEHEVAAYRLDKLLGLDMVPPVVERSYHGYAGSLQLWMDLPRSGLSAGKDAPELTDAERRAAEDATSLQRAFDSLVANADRTLQNLRYTEDGRLILIDHSQCFRDLPPYTGRLLYPVTAEPDEKGIGRLPRRFVERLRALTPEKVRAAVEDYLTSSEIRELLVRRDLLVRGLEALIRARGEDLVLY